MSFQLKSRPPMACAVLPLVAACTLIVLGGCQAKKVRVLEEHARQADAQIAQIAQDAEERLAAASAERKQVELDLALAQLHLGRASEAERAAISARIDTLDTRLESLKKIEQDLGQVKGRLDGLERLERGRANAVRRLIADWNRIDQDYVERYRQQ